MLNSRNHVDLDIGQPIFLVSANGDQSSFKSGFITGVDPEMGENGFGFFSEYREGIEHGSSRFSFLDYNCNIENGYNQHRAFNSLNDALDYFNVTKEVPGYVQKNHGRMADTYKDQIIIIDVPRPRHVHAGYRPQEIHVIGRGRRHRMGSTVEEAMNRSYYKPNPKLLVDRCQMKYGPQGGYKTRKNRY